MNVDKIRFWHDLKETITASSSIPSILDKIFTYVAHNPKNGLTKIGRSRNETARIVQLSCNHDTKLNLIALFERDIESILHRKYHDHSVGNEWFKLSDQQLLMLRRLSEFANNQLKT